MTERTQYLIFPPHSLEAKAFMTSQQRKWTLKLLLFSDFEFVNPDLNLSYIECVMKLILAIMDTLL